MMAFFLSMIRKKKFFVLYTPWCLLSSYKLDTNILSLISNMMLFWRLWAWQILYKQLNTMVDMFCLEWISPHILGFAFNIAMRNPISQNKSTKICIYLYIFVDINLIGIWLILIFCVLMPFSAIFQLYHGDQF